MGLKIVCDICGKELIVDDGHSEIQAYAVCVATTVHGWLAIWSPQYEIPGIKEGKRKRVQVGPLSGDITACSVSCAEEALAQLNKKHLEKLLEGDNATSTATKTTGEG